jgi:hypothetical protein
MIALGEDETPSNRDHEIFISTLNNNSTLPQTHSFFDGVCYLGAPNTIGIVNYMK